MSSGSERKNWWENMDWNLGGSVQEKLETSQRILRNLPSTISAHKLDKGTLLDQFQPDPVEKIKATAKPTPRMPNPKMLLPPPKPACLEKKRNLEKSQNLRKEDVPASKPSESSAEDDCEKTAKFTLEDLLTPDYCGYK